MYTVSKSFGKLLANRRILLSVLCLVEANHERSNGVYSRTNKQVYINSPFLQQSSHFHCMSSCSKNDFFVVSWFVHSAKKL